MKQKSDPWDNMGKNSTDKLGPDSAPSQEATAGRKRQNLRKAAPPESRKKDRGLNVEVRFSPDPNGKGSTRSIPDSSSGLSISDRILDSISQGAFTVNRDLEITSFNRAAETITGFSREEAIGMKCYHVFRADMCKSECALKKSLETGRDVVSQRTTIKDIDGDDVQIVVHTSVLRDGTLNSIGGVEVFRDVSSGAARLQRISEKYCFQDIISKNERIYKIFSTLPDIAKSDSTVLLQGPSGSGKELFARAIHNLSERQGDFIALNCGALPDTLLESELFGYKKGAFTGAANDKLGRFALAEKGTIFLDEIADISPALQLKLLRVIQERRFEPLGGVATVDADVRIVAATNKNLYELVEKGIFRSDLFFRLNVIKITLPSLAERKEDIPLLIQHFIHKFNKLKHKQIESVSPRVLNLLMRYDFPGNIRELENIIEYCFALCNTNVIDLNSLPEGFAEEMKENYFQKAIADTTPLSDAEAGTIREALHKFKGNRSQTAEHLGIDKTTLWRKMKKYNIEYPLGKK